MSFWMDLEGEDLWKLWAQELSYCSQSHINSDTGSLQTGGCDVSHVVMAQQGLPVP